MVAVLCRWWKYFNPFSASPIFGQVQKFFLENLLLARFLCWRDISRDLFFFFRERFEVIFHINMKKMKNQARNEIFKTNDHDLDLDPKRNLRPMDAKGFVYDSYFWPCYQFLNYDIFQ